MVFVLTAGVLSLSNSSTCTIVTGQAVPGVGATVRIGRVGQVPARDQPRPVC